MVDSKENYKFDQGVKQLNKTREGKPHEIIAYALSLLWLLWVFFFLSPSTASFILE